MWDDEKVTELPTDVLRSRKGEAVYELLVRPVSDELAAEIERWCERKGGTSELFLTAGFLSWLAKLTGRQQVTVAVERAEHKQRTVWQDDLSAVVSVDAWLTVLQEVCGESGLKGGLEETFCPVCLALSAAPEPYAGAEVIVALEGGERPQVRWCYDAALFAADTIRRMAAQLETLLTAMLADRNAPWQELAWLSAEDTALLDSFLQTEVPYPDDCTIGQLFMAQAGRSPDAVAVQYREAVMTYRELDTRANRLAHALRERGVRRGVTVALLLERSPEMIVSLLAVLRAGGAYLPIDPAAPQKRIDDLLADSGAAWAVTTEQLQPRLSACSGGIYCWEQERESLAAFPCTPPEEAHTPDDLAYIIYTSGSTGRPKGTMLTHRGVSNMATAQREAFGIAADSRILQLASFAFDASVFEIFFALLHGGTLVLADEAEVHNPSLLADLLTRQRIQFLCASPALLSQLDPEQAGRDLQVVVSAGEACPSALAEAWARRVHLINAYGPTESTVCATMWSSERDGAVRHPLPIGRPLPNCRIYILDAALQRVPVGVYGEICIASPGLARGYLGRPELTAERFIANPDQPGERLYRTGDIGRYLADGQIECRGRADEQVKIRGYRIEPGEVEAVLRAQAAVAECAVFADGEAGGSRRLLAYYTAACPHEVSDIRQMLRETLPAYMQPAHLIEVPAIPLTLSGKVDRRALPRPEDVITSHAGYAAPQNEVQLHLAEVWRDVLGVKELGIHDNFFLMGGDSLSIFPALIRLKPLYPALTLQDFYQSPTVAELERVVRERSAGVQEVTSTGDAGNEDVFLPSDAECSAAERCEPQAVLLTGATGFLGAHVLADLLRETNAHVYCLVRPVAGETGAQRLDEVLRWYFGTDALRARQGRVTVFSGDLSRPGLGMKAQDREQILRHLDTIIHCGADVRHYGDRAHFDSVNVQSTAELLDLATSCQHSVHMHYVSTLSVADSAARGNVYVASKFDAEQRVRAAMRQGLRATVHRIGNLVGQARTGRFQRNIESSSFYRLIKGTLLLGLLPEGGVEFDLTPVDYASRALVHAVCQAGAAGRTLHLCNPEPLTAADFACHLQALGYAVETVVLDRYQRQLLEPDATPERRTALELVVAAMEAQSGQTPGRAACAHTEHLLAGSGIACPPPSLPLVESLLRHGVERRFLPAPHPNFLQNAL